MYKNDTFNVLTLFSRVWSVVTKRDLTKEKLSTEGGDSEALRFYISNVASKRSRWNVSKKKRELPGCGNIYDNACNCCVRNKHFV